MIAKDHTITQIATASHEFQTITGNQNKSRDSNGDHGNHGITRITTITTITENHKIMGKGMTSAMIARNHRNHINRSESATTIGKFTGITRHQLKWVTIAMNQKTSYDN